MDSPEPVELYTVLTDDMDSEGGPNYLVSIRLEARTLKQLAKQHVAWTTDVLFEDQGLSWPTAIPVDVQYLGDVEFNEGPGGEPRPTGSVDQEALETLLPEMAERHPMRIMCTWRRPEDSLVTNPIASWQGQIVRYQEYPIAHRLEIPDPSIEPAPDGLAGIFALSERDWGKIMPDHLGEPTRQCLDDPDYTPFGVENTDAKYELFDHMITFVATGYQKRQRDDSSRQSGGENRGAGPVPQTPLPGILER